MNNTAYLSLGTNLGNRKKNLEQACFYLSEYISVDKISKVYETEPLYYEKQDYFYNCGVQISCNENPFQLLKLVKKIENQIGRVKSRRYGPRLIDIDIIFFFDQGIESIELKTKNLVIPHLMWRERIFVIEPFMELNISKYINSLIGTEEIEKLKRNQTITFVTELNI